MVESIRIRFILTVVLVSAIGIPTPVHSYNDGDYCLPEVFCIAMAKDGQTVSIRFESFVTDNFVAGVSWSIGGKTYVNKFMSTSPIVTVARKKLPDGASGKILTEYSYLYGDRKVDQPDGYVYELPWKNGDRHWVYQGYDIDSTHKYEIAYALDFGLFSQPVHAARGGEVVFLYDTINLEFDSVNAADNMIYIEHTDGTYGVYQHIEPGTFAVKKGDNVQKGQFLATSGDSGTKNLHLHFHVAKTTRDPLMIFETIPTKFRTNHGNIQLKNDVVYFSPPQ